MAHVADAVARRVPPAELLSACGAYYECPKAPDGQRLGPLVGYAGRDEQGRQFVGDLYINFAAAERHGIVLRRLAEELHARLMQSAIGRIDGYCGAPEGGKALATGLALLGEGQYIFPEKKVTELATALSREVSELAFIRHQPAEGETWILVEDVCNNFSTTAALAELVERQGARVAGVACVFNRSTIVQDRFVHDSAEHRLSFPVVSLVRKPLPQYSQDDPHVAADVRRGNVVWKPKHEWPALAGAMQAASALPRSGSADGAG